MKHSSVVQAPFTAGEHAGESQKCMMARSFDRPVARKECGSRYLANCRHKQTRVHIRRYAIEALLKPYGFASFVDAWWNDSLQTDSIRPMTTRAARSESRGLMGLETVGFAAADRIGRGNARRV
jgi:hypothetical protein